MEIQIDKEEQKKESIEIEYIDQKGIIASREQSIITPKKHHASIGYQNILLLNPTMYVVKKFINSMVKLKGFCEYFMLQVKDQEVTVIIENKDPVSHTSIHYEALLTYASQRADFNVYYNIEYIIEIMKLLDHGNIRIGIEKDMPLIVRDNDKMFVLAPIIF